jgi:pimeloyl-ACP methyl ester carboxylesterase
MTDQFRAAAPNVNGNGAAARPAEGNGSAPKRQFPVWPGELVALPIGEVFVRKVTAPADAEPAVFVHGLGGSALNWTDLMGLAAEPCGNWPGLAGEALDLPGFGHSPPPPDGDYSLDARARAVIALIEHRGNSPVHLIGNSLGGAVSTRIAARRPGLVRSLTLISPALPDLRPRLLPMRLALVATPGIGRWLLKRVLQIPPEQRTAMAYQDLFADPRLLTDVRRAEAVAEVIRRDSLDHAGDAMVRSGRALVTEYTRHGPGSLWREAEHVTAPTLVIHGSHDRLVHPANAGRAARTFGNCRVVVLPKIGHVAMMERPDIVAAEMRDFLSGPAAAVGSGQAELSQASR